MRKYITSLDLIRIFTSERKKIDINVFPVGVPSGSIHSYPYEIINDTLTDTINCLINFLIFFTLFISSPILIIRDIILIGFKKQNLKYHISSIIKVPFLTLSYTIINLIFSLITLLFGIFSLFLFPIMDL